MNKTSICLFKLEKTGRLKRLVAKTVSIYHKDTVISNYLCLN